MDHNPRLKAYAIKYKTTLFNMLGFGIDGEVWQTNHGTAVKSFYAQPQFDRECEVYQVLTELNIVNIAGHAVPIFVSADADLLAIEMSIAAPPFILDFAAARLEHEVPDFEDHVIDELHSRLMILYGNRWTDALAVADAFARETGYVLMDIKPGNISL